MLAVFQEVQIVVNVDPAGVSVSQYSFGRAGFTIGEIETELMLIASECLHAQATTIGQPLGTEDKFKRTIGDVYPRCRFAANLDNPDTHARIGHTGFLGNVA